MAKNSKKTGKKQQKNRQKTRIVYIDRKTRKRIKVIPFSETVTWEEKKLVIPLIVERIKREHRFFGQAISNPHIVNSLYKHDGIKVSQPTVRKLIHYIRVNGILKNLIAGHFGYYISRDPKKIINYLKKLNKMQKEIGIFKKAIEQQTLKLVTAYNKKNKK